MTHAVHPTRLQTVQVGFELDKYIAVRSNLFKNRFCEVCINYLLYNIMYFRNLYNSTLLAFGQN